MKRSHPWSTSGMLRRTCAAQPLARENSALTIRAWNSQKADVIARSNS